MSQEVSEVLQLAAVHPDMGFLDLGMDSLMAVEFRNRLNRGLGLEPPLPATALFDHPNIRSLAQLWPYRRSASRPSRRRSMLHDRMSCFKA